MKSGTFGRGIFLTWLLSIGLLMATPSWATPPTPPATIVLAEDISVGKLEAREGIFVLPLQMRIHEDVKDLAIHWRLVEAGALDRKTVKEGRVALAAKSQRGVERVELQIPALRTRGRYRMEIELGGRIGDKPAIVDRLVLYQINEDDKPVLTTAPELRRRDSAQRKESFRKQLQQHPDRPDIRLLSPATMTIPPNIAGRVTSIKDRPPLLVQGIASPAMIRRHTVDRQKDSWSHHDPITVRGRLVYQDFEGTWRPLVNASVNLFDDDTFGDEHLGTTVTDWNGNWSFTVNNDDGFLQNGRDIYYEFHLGNTRWDVRDADGDDYVWQSAVHDDLSDGSVVDFGDETGSTDGEAMQVFAVLNLGWNHITTAGGQDPGMIKARYPTTGSFFSPSAETVNIDTADNDGPDTILHEYGHALMHKAFGGTSISPGGPHGFGDDSQDSGLAYSEGWGTGFMLSVCPDGMYNWHEGNTEGAGEWPTCTAQNDGGQAIEQFSDAGNRIGERNEGRVAAALHDFLDQPNDTNGGTEDRGRNSESDANSSNRISLATIFRDSMWGFVHNDFLNFWVTFAGNLSGATRTQADDIMQYNWMSLPADVSCVASKVSVAERKDASTLLEGLRAFRDKGLKPLQVGRHWIQTYYSHSPELAMLLLRDAEARKAAVDVIVHFAELGKAFANHRTLERMLTANAPVLPQNIDAAIQRLLRTVEKSGSPELQREVEPIRESLRPFQGLTLAQAMALVDHMAPAEKGGAMSVIRPRDLSPASRKADWQLIRQHLPPSEGIPQTSGRER